MNTKMVRWAGLIAIALAWLLVPPVAAQQSSTISGRVTDQATGQPMPGARVLIDQANRATDTDDDGRYQFANVAVGGIQVRVVAIGYQSQVAQVNTTAGATTTVDFQLQRAVVSLDEIVVTATGEQRRRELGNAVGTIAASEVVEQSPITSATDLLQGRVAGVIVGRDGGTTGTSSRIRIRGSNSISLANDPLVYVDGIRVESANDASQLGVGGQDVSRLDDLNPEEIESIEIIKGPSAATLYGTEAANGVIRITTKRGRAGDTRWNVYTEQGTLWDPNDYPSVYAGVDTDNADADLVRNCRLDFVAAGLCSQDSVASFNVLENERTSPFGNGRRQQYGVSTSGGSQTLRFYVAGEFEEEVGTARMPDAVVDSLRAADINVPGEEIQPNAVERIRLRANLDAQLRDNASLAISTGYVSSDFRRTNNDNSSFGILPSGYFGNAFEDERGGWGFALPEESMRRLTKQSVERFTSSVSGNWQPLGWLTGRATIGLDLTNQHDFRTDFIFASTGARASTRTQIFQYTMDAGGTANLRLTPAVTSRTSAGVQFFRDLFTQTVGSGTDLAAGCNSLNCSAITQSNEGTTESRTLGVYLEQQFGLNDRIYITGGVRGDDNSAFGRDFDIVLYPKVQGSWLLSEEPFFPGGLFDELRLRAAFGSSGLQPGTLEAVRYFNAVSSTVETNSGQFQDVIGVTVGELGNPELKPERSTEFEGGLDAGLFSGRLGLELTYYHKKTRDALVDRELAPSLGVSVNRFENIGSVRNSGFEALLDARILDGYPVNWDLTLSGAVNNNELLELGEGIEPFGGLQRFVEGYPLGAYWDEPLLDFADDDGNGIITEDELVVGDTIEFLGEVIPPYQASLRSSFTLFDRLRVSGLFDYQGGHKLFNNTESFRCDTFKKCRAVHDPSTPLEDQARAALTTFHSTKSRSGFIEDADFIKFRELSLTFFFPDAWARAFRAQRAEIVLTGRNLATWTDYTGLDPEINSQGGANFGASEFLSQAPVRFFSARLNLTF